MKRINRTTFIRLVEKAISEQKESIYPLTDEQRSTLLNTASTTDHFLVGKWGNCQCGCLVGQSYNDEHSLDHWPRQVALEMFGLRIDVLVRDHTGILPSAFSGEEKLVVKVVNR